MDIQNQFMDIRKRIIDIHKWGIDSKTALTAQLISAFVFATRIVQFIFCLNPIFLASSLIL